MEGKYPFPPFVLINFNGSFTSVKTTAHEFGHAMHTVLTAKNNEAFNYAKYPIFITEVPSTVNEMLMLWYGIENAPDKVTELAYSMEVLELYRQTVFRQAKFSMFEKEITDKVQSGGTLDAEYLNKTYADLMKKTYGPDLAVDKPYDAEWAYIPHFLEHNFYVQNYASCIVAGLAIAKKIKAGEAGVRNAYLQMLGKGGSEDPVKLLKEIGVDMTTTKPYERFAAEMMRVMDRIHVLRQETKK